MSCRKGHPAVGSDHVPLRKVSRQQWLPEGCELSAVLSGARGPCGRRAALVLPCLLLQEEPGAHLLRPGQCPPPRPRGTGGGRSAKGNAGVSLRASCCTAPVSLACPGSVPGTAEKQPARGTGWLCRPSVACGLCCLPGVGAGVAPAVALSWALGAAPGSSGGLSPRRGVSSSRGVPGGVRRPLPLPGAACSTLREDPGRGTGRPVPQPGLSPAAGLHCPGAPGLGSWGMWPRPLPPALTPLLPRPLTFMSETDGKHRLVGRCLMVATLVSATTASAARDGLGAGTISSGLSATGTRGRQDARQRAKPPHAVGGEGPR